MAIKKYTNKTTLEAARERIKIIFDNFDSINVSFSGGKDSTVLIHLCLQEAQKRNRKITCFFLDQEAEYQETINQVEQIMRHPLVVPAWYQVPIRMTNATSLSDVFLNAWGKGEKWMREKSPIAIHEAPGAPDRFYDFFPWYEKNKPETAFLVGLRAEESLTRFRAVTKKAGWGGYKWSNNSDCINKFYPIYDWTVYDVWKFIYEYNISYNNIYDKQFKAGYSIYKNMRVSCLIHEKSYKCLSDLPKFEPETYDKLCQRISGISTASRYATEKLIFSNKTLPKHYATWFDFKEFLLKNIQDQKIKERFEKRFFGQPKTEKTYRAQVGQLLVMDYENSLSIDLKRDEKIDAVRKKWMDIL